MQCSKHTRFCLLQIIFPVRMSLLRGYIFPVVWGFEYFTSLFLGEVTLGCFTVEKGTQYV